MNTRFPAFVALLILAAPALARAQNGFNGVPLIPPPGGVEFVPPASPDDEVSVFSPDPRGGGAYSIRLGNFASAQDLTATNTQLSALSAQMTSVSGQIAQAVASLQSRANQGAALAASFTIVPPNPGDRFSLTVDGAEFSGEGAGSITATYRATERVLVFGGYARSSSFNLFKGGVSLSFN